MHLDDKQGYSRSLPAQELPYESGESALTKVIVESKTICYCSNFDLNVNEWFNEYENIEIFKMNMKKNLGTSTSPPTNQCYRLHVAPLLRRGSLQLASSNPSGE